MDEKNSPYWQEVLDFALDLEGACADCPFEEDFVTTVLRHSDSGKWFGILMRVAPQKVGRQSDIPLELLNVKIAPEDGFVARELFDSILPAYHMNKTHWVTVVLDGSVPSPFVNRMIAKSYLLTKKRGKKGKQDEN